MTETQRQNQPAQQPATGQDTGARRSSTPAVFGDGSTREQQQQRVKAAETANRETKEFADADRKARGSD